MAEVKWFWCNLVPMLGNELVCWEYDFWLIIFAFFSSTSWRVGTFGQEIPCSNRSEYESTGRV